MMPMLKNLIHNIIGDDTYYIEFVIYETQRLKEATISVLLYDNKKRLLSSAALKSGSMYTITELAEQLLK